MSRYPEGYLLPLPEFPIPIRSYEMVGLTVSLTIISFPIPIRSYEYSKTAGTSKNLQVPHSYKEL